MGAGVISGAGDVHGCRLELVDGRAWGWIDGCMMYGVYPYRRNGTRNGVLTQIGTVPIASSIYHTTVWVMHLLQLGGESPHSTFGCFFFRVIGRD